MTRYQGPLSDHRCWVFYSDFENTVAISEDVWAMFHQLILLPQDCPLVCFLWRDMDRDHLTSMNGVFYHLVQFAAHVAPYMLCHIRDHQSGNKDLLEMVITSFYVDNCLKSLRSPQQAKDLLDCLRTLLAKGGFEIRQWAFNRTEVISHQPAEARSTTSELWLTPEGVDPRESTLGLVWHCMTDTLGYKCQPVSPKPPTMRNVYRVLASQYDLLGYIIPFTTRAKVLVQALWATERQWDELIAVCVSLSCRT